MPPRLVEGDPRDIVHGDTEAFCDHTSAHSCCAELSNLPNVFSTQLCAVLRFPPRLVSPAFADHINGIIALSAEEQGVSRTTRGVVASVAHFEFAGIGAVVQAVSDSVRSHIYSF
jgi:hypothetical protein